MNQYIVMEQRVSDGLVLRCCGIKKSFDEALGRLFRCILKEYSFDKNKIVQEDYSCASDVVDSYVIDDKIRFFIVPFDNECLEDI